MKTFTFVIALLGVVMSETPPCFKRNHAERAKVNPTLAL